MTTSTMDSTQLIQSMTRKGLRPDTISELTGLPRQEIVRITKHYSYTPADQEIISAARQLALKILTEASLIMDRGMPDTKLRVMASFLPVMARMIGQVQDEVQEELRISLEELFGGQRAIS